MSRAQTAMRRVTGYLRPTSLREAVAALDETGEAAYPLAGGTDLAVGVRQGRTPSGVIIDLKSIPELAPAIEWKGEKLVINANTSMADIEHEARLTERIPGIGEAARLVGSVQIRNRATIAGNLCNASPAADTPPMLMALGASVVAVGPEGERHIEIDDFFTRYRTTALERAELVKAVEIPEVGARTGTAFLKLGVRRAMEISIVCVGARVEVAEDGVIADVGLGLGSVAPLTVRPVDSEDLLKGRRPTTDLLAEASSAALDVCEPIDDIRASAEYRRAMVPVLVRRALAVALDRVGVSG